MSLMWVNNKHVAVLVVSKQLHQVDDVFIDSSIVSAGGECDVDLEHVAHVWGNANVLQHVPCCLTRNASLRVS